MNYDGQEVLVFELISHYGYKLLGTGEAGQGTSALLLKLDLIPDELQDVISSSATLH